MITKIKTNKARSFIEVEGEQEFVEKTYKEFPTNEKKEDYGPIRKCISFLLIAVIIILVFTVFLFINGCWDKIILGFTAGLAGLFTRNLVFMSGSIEEKPGKKLLFSYSAYLLFIFASTLLILGLLKLYLSNPDLFYFFLLPLNFYVGLMTYSVIDKILDKLFSIKVGN